MITEPCILSGSTSSGCETSDSYEHEMVVNPATPSFVSLSYFGGTLTKRVTSGLKSGVSTNRRNRFRMRWRRGRRLTSPRPRLRRSASLSTSSVMSRVSRQSNSLTVHLRCSSTSRRSSTLRSGASRASYNSCIVRMVEQAWNSFQSCFLLKTPGTSSPDSTPRGRETPASRGKLTLMAS